MVQSRSGTKRDHRMMVRALTLAARGTGQVSPGPLVGCVITTAEGEVIGEGFYVYASGQARGDSGA